MSNQVFYRVSPVFVSISIAIVVSAWTGCSSRASFGRAENGTGPAKVALASTPDRDETGNASRGTGRIVEPPPSLREFSPKESGVRTEVAADQLDLRAVFEDLGPDATLWYQHVQTLANPFFGGREPGTDGDEVAARYIEFWFQQYGLEPAFTTEDLPDYRQPFDFPAPNPEVTVLESSFAINGRELVDQLQFTLLGNTGSGEVTAPITFVGYGIEEGRDGYTSFDENTDLTGRIALVLRYEPLDESGKSQWSEARFSRFAAVAPKMEALAKRGAAGVILVNPPDAVDGKTTLESLKESSRFGRRMKIPTVQLSQDAADKLLRLADTDRRDLLTMRKLADRGEVKCVNLDDSVQVTLTASIEAQDRINTYNVGAVLRGRGDLAGEWIVVGGHYDHLGFGYTGARPDNIGKLHPGADDNASGVSAMLVAAKRLSNAYDDSNENANMRSIAFIAFGAEEAGLHGSRYFVENSPIGNENVVLMVNLDMVGRLRSDNLMIQGMSTAKHLEEILLPHIESSGLKVSPMPGGRGPSDHSNFYGKDIPVVFMFTGETEDYHKPSDRAYTVNPAGAAKVIDLVERVAFEIAKRPERLEFTPSTGGRGGRDTGARVTLGTMPDYGAELETGMRVESVRDGSSAANAGIQGGDILLMWNGEEVTGAAKLAELLGKHEPGDRVQILLQRGDQQITVTPVLQGRAVE
jgi:Zn-dependent M28 family amino/carboxypeptidase